MYKLIIKNDMSTWQMKVRVFQVPDYDTRIPEINSGFASCYPKFPNKIRVSGISGLGLDIPISGYGFFAEP
jgi:hypothetical protein